MLRNHRSSRRIQVNAYALTAAVADTDAGGFHRSLAGVLSYPFALVVRGSAYGVGVGQYFGPLVLAFAPLVILSVRKRFLARAAAAMWLAVLLSNALTSQIARFVLPALPMALALVFAGMAESWHRGWKLVRVTCGWTLLLFLIFGIGSEAMYAKDFLPVSLGLESQAAFLDRIAPDYPAAAFINWSLHETR